MTAPVRQVRWHTAHCCDCRPFKTMQYRTTEERNAWADTHAEHVGHPVQKWSTNGLKP